MSKLGNYTKETQLAHLDGRTKEGRCLKHLRAVLVVHLGGEARLSNVQRTMIERVLMIQLQIAQLDAKILDGTPLTDATTAIYLNFTASLADARQALEGSPKQGSVIDTMIAKQQQAQDAA